MKKARIYIPAKTAMQSGYSKQNTWLLEFETKSSFKEPHMGWESSEDTLAEIKLEFPSKEKAIEYAKKNNIIYKVINPNKKKFILKSYTDNFLE